MDRHNLNKIFDGIVITHFINPHMFWFRPETTYNGCAKFSEFEYQLNDYFERANSQRFYSFISSGHIPKKDEIVAVYISCWSKWIRGKIDRIYNVLNDDKKFVIWALDLGFPLQCEEKHIKPLPKEFQSENFHLYYYAGISHVIPCEKTFNFLKMDYEVKQLKDWGPNAIRQFENCNLRSSKTKFYVEFEYKKQLFGRLEFKTNEDSILDMANVLVELEIGLRPAMKTDFIKDLDKQSTTKLKRYLTNEGIISFSKLNYNKLSVHNLKHPIMSYRKTDTLPSLEVAKKIIDWTQMNEKRLRKYEALTEQMDDHLDLENEVSLMQVNETNQVATTNDKGKSYINCKCLMQQANERKMILKEAMDDKFDINVETNEVSLESEENHQQKCSQVAISPSSFSAPAFLTMSRIQRDLNNKCLLSRGMIAEQNKENEFLAITASLNKLSSTELNREDEASEMKRIEQRRSSILKSRKRTSVLTIPAGFDLGRLECSAYENEI